jgi:hypothetical protein
MKWFIVKYLYQIVIGEREQHGQFDEQTRLIVAFDRAEALLKAESLAGGFHETFENCGGERVHWKFICIEGLREIDAPHDGQELCSSLYEPKDVSEFLNHAYKQKQFLELELMDCSVFS